MLSWISGSHKKAIKRHNPYGGYTTVDEDERGRPPKSGINILLIVASFASFLAAYTFNSLTSTIKDQGAEIKSIHQDMAAVVEWKGEMSKWQDSMNTQILAVQQQVATDEAYLGIRKPLRRGNP